MSKSIGIQDSESIQKFYVCSNSLKSLMAQRDQLLMRRGKIEKEESLSHRQKERQLMILDSEIDNLKSQINSLKQEEEKKEQEKELKQRMEHMKDATEEVPWDFNETNKSGNDTKTNNIANNSNNNQSEEELKKYSQGDLFDLYS